MPVESLARSPRGSPAQSLQPLVEVQQAELAAVNGEVNRKRAADFQRVFAMPTVRQRLRELDLPMLLVHGEADPRPVEALAGELPRSRLVVLDRVAHFPYWEAPETLRRLLREFLEVPSPRRSKT